MNFFPHIPMLSTVFNSIGCYLLPFGVVLLWLLYESKKVKTILLAALVLLSMVCMFFHEAFAPSREYPWDCMVEHIFTGTLLPFLCLLGYLLYVFLCACIPVLAVGVIPGICLIGVVSAILFPPPESFICDRIHEEMERDMALWNYQSNLVLLSSRFLNMERENGCITVKYYCETNMGPAVYKAFCNNYGGYVRAECFLLNR